MRLSHVFSGVAAMVVGVTSLAYPPYGHYSTVSNSSTAANSTATTNNTVIANSTAFANSTSNARSLVFSNITFATSSSASGTGSACAISISTVFVALSSPVAQKHTADAPTATDNSNIYYYVVGPDGITTFLNGQTPTFNAGSTVHETTTLEEDPGSTTPLVVVQTVTATVQETVTQTVKAIQTVPDTSDIDEASLSTGSSPSLETWVSISIPLSAVEPVFSTSQDITVTVSGHFTHTVQATRTITKSSKASLHSYFAGVDSSGWNSTTKTASRATGSTGPTAISLIPGQTTECNHTTMPTSILSLLPTVSSPNSTSVVIALSTVSNSDASPTLFLSSHLPTPIVNSSASVFPSLVPSGNEGISFAGVSSGTTVALFSATSSIIRVTAFTPSSSGNLASPLIASSVSSFSSDGIPSSVANFTTPASISSTTFVSKTDVPSSLGNSTTPASVSSTSSVSPMSSLSTSTPLASGTNATAPATALPSSSPTLCGESGNFTLTWDDEPIYVPENPDDVQFAPVFNPYNHFFFANGYAYLAPPKEPYTPTSNPNVAIFMPNLTTNNANSSVGVPPGEIGAGPRANNDIWWFDAYSADMGCDNGESCTMAITGYQYDNVSQIEVQVVQQVAEIPPCGQIGNCKLDHIEFGAAFRGLSGISFEAYGDETRSRVFVIDSLSLGWFRNDCDAGLTRISQKKR